MPLKSRVERLERRDAPETHLMIVIGEATPEQQALLDQGKVRRVIRMPDNGRGDHGHEQC